ncbi:GNAT family N-acetyltransferase [Phenylobacterium sp. LH3H17]|uniref:GNAT family N-acetyltransferase n=1 Tax=Phenylobacterium sp. LH3H17 TaxID=2903901 RepID=UPI0020C9E3BF|nr:GNAT family protein [Phenylobacterium sp. LH3H17]UTP37826.1 GNAT family N-acetyltransferase [Phenylobacterium sp. LH3H17]
MRHPRRIWLPHPCGPAILDEALTSRTRRIPISEGKSVSLRLIEAADLPRIAPHLFTVSITEPLTELPRLQAVHAATGLWLEDSGAVAIVENDGGRMVGTMQFYRSSPVIHGYELGYIVHDPADRGKGYASEATRLLTGLLFDERPDCFRLQLIIETWNEASWRIAERCGYTREALLRKAGFSTEDPEDCYLYARIRGG